MLGKLRQAALALANVPLKRGLSGWCGTLAEQRAKLELIRAAARGIINAKARKAYGAWQARCAEANELKRKLQQAVAMMSTEGRAKKAFVRKLQTIRMKKLAMRKALAGFIMSGCRYALRVMSAQVEGMRKLRRGGNAIRMRKARQCYNVWSEMAADAVGRKARMGAAMARMTPEGRMLNYGMQRMIEQLVERQQMRAALAGFINGSAKRALTAWIEATFEAFHIAAGLDGHQKYRVRRAVLLWVSRARIRRGLRKEVWVAAQKGAAELPKLREMSKESDIDDLANAIIARDQQGSTPLLCMRTPPPSPYPNSARPVARSAASTPSARGPVRPSHCLPPRMGAWGLRATERCCCATRPSTWQGRRKRAMMRWPTILSVRSARS